MKKKPTILPSDQAQQTLALPLVDNPSVEPEHHLYDHLPDLSVERVKEITQAAAASKQKSNRIRKNTASSLPNHDLFGF